MDGHGIGLDLGSSSVRAVVVDGHGRADPALIARRPVRIAHGSDGSATLDAAAYLGAVAACLDELAAAPRLPAIEVVAVASQWHSLVPVDAWGEPVGPVITWADARPGRWRRPGPAVMRDAAAAEAVRQRTGCSLHGLYWTTRLPWWRDHAGTDAAAFWGVGELVRCLLTDEPAITLSMASGTGLLDQDRLAWDEEALDVAGVRAGELAPLGPTRVERLGPRGRQRWPALADAAVVGPIGDGAAANLGSGSTDEHAIAVTIGTSAAARVVHRRAGAVVPAGCWRYLVDEERAITGRAWSAGGNVMRWARDNLRLPEGDIESLLTEQVVAPGSVLALPFMFGSRPPEERPAGSGELLGLDAATTPIDLLVGLLDGVACEIALGIDAMTGIAAHGAVVVAGGGALDASPWWCQRLCDLIGRPLAYASGPEVAARGVVAAALGTVLATPQVSLSPADDPAFSAQRARYARARASRGGYGNGSSA
jgi:gluconokinase